MRRAHPALAPLLLAITIVVAAGAAAASAVPPVPGSQPARALTLQGLDNLVALTRLLGYVRYFHPSDSAAAVDWDAFTIAAVDSVEPAETQGKLLAVLRRLFLPIAPAIRIDLRPVLVDSASLVPEGSRLTGAMLWEHHGYGSGIADNEQFKSFRSRRPLAGPGAHLWDADASITTRIGASLWCAVPLVLYTDSLGTLPRARDAAPPPRPERAGGWKPSGDDRATRLADVALFWNVAQHFDPYLREVGADWPAALREALTRAAADADGRSFHDTLCRLMAGLHDGHGWVYDRYDTSPTLPLAWDWVEDRLVITDAPADSTGPGTRRGDVVLAIDGVSVERRFADVAPLLGASTPQNLRWKSLQPLARGAGRDTVVLELRDPAGAERHVALSRRLRGWSVAPRRATIDEVRPGIFYVDCNRITDDALDSALTRLVAARGIVFDMRGYPYQLSSAELGHLLDQPARSYRTSIPLVILPDGKRMIHSYAQTTVLPEAPRLKARVAFLMDGRAQSSAEHYLGILAGAKAAELVGGPTAGVDGNTVSVPLPGDYRIRFTAMHVVRQDGLPFHGIGVLPTVPVARTIRGVAAGRDEVLEKAIEVVSRP